MSDPTKKKFHRSLAIAAAREILANLPTERVIIAGSLRRRKEMVGDIEILYIPKKEIIQDPNELFEKKLTVNLTDQAIESMIAGGTRSTASHFASPLLGRRENVLGSTTWGDKNKLALHIASGIPVDFFATDARAWFNYLVCRTGGAINNTRIATAAQRKGWSWHPYRSGFTAASGEFVPVHSEQDVFRLAGLPYLEPWDRP